ncbi:hypothetical protein OCOL_001777 [Ordospora colligata]
MDVYPYRGYILYHQDKYEDSVTFLNDLIKRYPESKIAKRFLYKGLMKINRFRQSFDVAKQCWKEGDCRRSTLIWILAYSFVFQEYDMLDVVSIHTESQLIISLGYMCAGRFERAVELMNEISGHEEAKYYLDAFLSICTRSLWMLDYAWCIDESVMIRQINMHENKGSMFSKVVRQGCEYVDEKVLYVAKHSLSKEEYALFEARFRISDITCMHTCNRRCLIRKLRMRHEEIMYYRNRKPDLVDEHTALHNASEHTRSVKHQERYSELNHALDSLSDNCYKGVMEIKSIYTRNDCTDIGEYLKEKQNIFVLNKIRNAYSLNGNAMESSRYAFLERCVYLSYFKDTFEHLLKQIDGGMVSVIIEVLNSRMFRYLSDCCSMDENYGI